ncbi:MAG TPA: PilZ domain-containing protein [Polyangia bacterium]|nr:PilZ domain-containing protein [Polyangia bacterium]
MLSLSPDNRRQAQRLRMRVFMNEYVADRPCQAIARDVSETGLALLKLPERTRPSTDVVALELELPGTNETIWAAAQSRFESLTADYQISGLRFLSMARKHERLIRDYVRERRERLARLFTLRPLTTSRFA